MRAAETHTHTHRTTTVTLAAHARRGLINTRSRQQTPTAFWEGREHQRYSKAKENPSPRRSAYRRFILGHGVETCSPLEYRWRFLVTGRVGERDGGDFDAESVHSSMPTEKRSSLHGGGETETRWGGRTRFSGYVTFTRILRVYCLCASCRAGRPDDLTSAVSLWRGSDARAKALA